MRVSASALLAPVAALLLTCAPAALVAQEVVQALPGTTDADRLAEQMRALAANPRNLNALIAAADLSLSLDDLSGAASLYARAEKVSANDPRIKAGEGAILVRSERPGEALRYFQQAEAAGYDVTRFAADRGLAYDLIGQQERAQRDYRLALKTQPSDEVVKRYALSLGIAGKREAALEQLDPLVRKSDRSAWRVRAFVLAMSGDQAGAEKIVTTMLPAGMAQGLVPFFRRLPALPAADRAFAVHFGEVHATPERLADARLAPVLPQLAPEAPPVALAATQTVPVQPNARQSRRRRADRNAAPSVALAQATSQPAPRAAAPSAPAVPPSYQAATTALARVQPLPQAPATAPVTLASAAPVTARPPVAAASTASTPQPTPTPTPIPTPTPAPSVATLASTRTADRVAAPTGALPSSARSASLAPAPQPAMPSTATVAVASLPPTTTTATTTAPAVAAVPSPSPAAAVVQPLPASAAASPAPDSPRPDADSVLARIVAGLSIPASELGVTEPVRAAPVVAAPAPDTAARVLAEAKAKEERDAAAEKALAAKAAADKRAADRKAAADKKALAAKKLADEKKLAEAKAAAEEKKAARANPARIWVQVAGGAYEGDLPKAYAAVKAKAPAVFGSRTGWSTPLRATNRVLTGPFKTDAEARTFVNQLAKAGVSAFSFTSEAGQVVTRLSAK